MQILLLCSISLVCFTMEIVPVKPTHCEVCKFFRAQVFRLGDVPPQEAALKGMCSGVRRALREVKATGVY